MKICPQCKTTYENNNMTQCSNCGSQLVSWKSPEPDEEIRERKMYCLHCQKIYDSGDIAFCKSCGSRLVVYGEAGGDMPEDNSCFPYEPEFEPESYPEPEPLSYAENQKPRSSGMSETLQTAAKTNSNNNIIPVLLICVSLLAIAATALILVLFFGKDKENEIEFNTMETVTETETVPTSELSSSVYEEETVTEAETAASAEITSVAETTVTVVTTAETTTEITVPAPDHNADIWFPVPVSEENGMSNIANGGQVCTDGDYYYYSRNGIYKTDGMSGTVKLADFSAYYLNEEGEYLYFTDSESNYICRMKKDGTGYETLLNEYCYELTLYNDWLYFSRQIGGNSCICRMRTDGTDLQELKECYVWYMSLANDTVFFVNYDDGYKLYAMNTDGSNQRILNGSECSDICIVEDKIYYSSNRTDRNLFVMNMDGTGITQLNSVYTKHTNYAGGKLYYVSSDKRLYSCELDGSGVALCSDKEVSYPQVFDDCIYYYGENDLLQGLY